ncbi:MAG: SH3 domain-containing protein, partial [Chloroflexota bacterium]
DPMRPLLLLMCLITLSLQPLITTSQDDCNNDSYLESRLRFERQAQVTWDGSSNRVRAEPSLDAEELFQIPPGHVFTINYNSRVCNDGVVWYEIDYLDGIGWTAESYLTVSSDYFIEPLTAIQTIDETVSLNNGAVALAFTPDNRQLTMVLADNSLLWFNLFDNTTGTANLALDEPILDLAYHPDGSGIYATIHERSIKLWNSNHDLIRTVTTRMLDSHPSIFELDDDWEFIANAGCYVTDDNDECTNGGIVIIDPNTDADIAVFESENYSTIRDLDFKSTAWTTPGGTNYRNNLWAISENTRHILELRDIGSWYRSIWSESQVIPSPNTLAVMESGGMFAYGGCNDYQADVCVEGYLEVFVPTRGSNFNTIPSEVTDILLSPIDLSDSKRLFALTVDQTVYMIDYSHNASGVEMIITTLEDIPAQTMALSPNGTVLAIASGAAVILYDVSVVDE